MNSYQAIKTEIEKLFEDGVVPSFSLDQPDDTTHGEYATNVSFVLSKRDGISPKDAAEKYAPTLQEQVSSVVEKVEVAGPGFINFFLKKEVLLAEVEKTAKQFIFILDATEKGKVMVEYTDPNPFKLFHIGHVVPNAIGEALAGIYESNGYQVSRISYQGDVGMHVAKTIWGIQNTLKNQFPEDGISLKEKVTYLGNAYAVGNGAYENKENVQTIEEIKGINKKIFERSDEEINRLYDLGKKWSLDYFETLYEKVGTKFDHYIFESEVADIGKEIVKKNVGTVFEESDGAIVYKGEKVGLHTRVFINSEGLPTYEAKDIGNAYKKEELVPGNEKSIVVTGNEIDEYFKVVKAALSEIDKPLSERLVHVSHGMLRLPEGKMSSRKGNVISAEELIDEVSKHLVEKFKDMEVPESEKTKLVNDIAVAAIKFSILKIAPGKDIIFDLEKSISFEGDSGPYLQYTHARMWTLLAKAQELGIESSRDNSTELGHELSRLILLYPQVLTKSFNDLGPHHIVNYLLLLTRAFNSLYGATQFLDIEKSESGYYVLLTQATRNILAHGLQTLGMVAPNKM